MTRLAQQGRVFFFEEPIFQAGETRLEISARGPSLFVCTPHIDPDESSQALHIQRLMIDMLIADKGLSDYLLWFYTPSAMEFAAHLHPSTVVFDCMDELSTFRFAPASLLENEKKLLDFADLVFTGGPSLFEAKKNRHERAYLFPSSIDKEHFWQARQPSSPVPPDQLPITGTKLGYCGVIDERMDTNLIGEMATNRPDWQFIMLGPVVKIALEDLPRRPNIHYLGGKSYAELPHYLASWDIALLPFALNESTKFISPTKTPEYLAAGKPVISTPIRDVVTPYGSENLVCIADDAAGFIHAAEQILASTDRSEWLTRVDDFLDKSSWDETFAEMLRLISATTSSRRATQVARR